MSMLQYSIVTCNWHICLSNESRRRGMFCVWSIFKIEAGFWQITWYYIKSTFFLHIPCLVWWTISFTNSTCNWVIDAFHLNMSVLGTPSLTTYYSVSIVEIFFQQQIFSPVSCKGFSTYSTKCIGIISERKYRALHWTRIRHEFKPEVFY
jgi:hypothetical protein